jgi:formylglycine-generating enzyme required for sulfatase activity
MLMEAEPRAFATLFPPVQRRRAQTVPRFEAELARQARPEWNDPPLDPSWTVPDAAVMRQIEAAQGILAERFAFCQTMPLDEFLHAAEALRRSGYRPTRFRPHADGAALRVAAVWTRDGRPWRIASGLAAAALVKTDEQNRNEHFLPVDVAAYNAGNSDGGAGERFAGLWARKAKADDDARLYVDATAADHKSVTDRLKADNLVPRTVQAVPGPDGRTRYCGVWERPASAAAGWNLAWAQSERSFVQNQAAQADNVLIDVGVSTGEPAQSTRERAQANLETAETSLKAKPDDPSARFARATARMQLDDPAKALDDLDFVCSKAPRFAAAFQTRALAHARLGHKEPARADVAKFRESDGSASAKLYLAAVVAAELGEGAEEAFQALDQALETQSQDAGLRYDAACAHALASRALARSDADKGRRHAERALEELRSALRRGYSDHAHIQEDPDLDPIRALREFTALLKDGHLERAYTAVWRPDPFFAADASFELDPAAHLERCRELAAQGFRPVAASAARTTADGPLVTASAWQRPVVSDEAYDHLARRQARAAVALVRLGRAEAAWSLLKHGPDPSLRSYLVNWLEPLGAEPNALASRLEGLPAEAAGKPASMDAILYHPETSVRRALILTLGHYDPNALSPAAREPLVARLLAAYRDDPDAGIHGAAEWTLRRWEQQESLAAADAELKVLKDRGSRRWFVNREGQTLALVEGPVEFDMGSPPHEPDRFDTERLHRQNIPRRFAIAAKEVTVAQLQRFRRANPKIGHTYTKKYSPDPDGPMISVTWYEAAAYCDWLSRQEGLAPCYEPNAAGDYAEGMKIVPDALTKDGYRLPTEAEWEYACRAGAATSRHYGRSTGLLEQYAWYAADSHERTWPGGRLEPNDLGLFDTLGNVYEWCLDPAAVYGPKGTGEPDNIYKSSYITDKNLRLLRGGAFTIQPANVRSAFRSWNVPSNRYDSLGFRLARTYP